MIDPEQIRAIAEKAAKEWMGGFGLQWTGLANLIEAAISEGVEQAQREADPEVVELLHDAAARAEVAEEKARQCCRAEILEREAREKAEALVADHHALGKWPDCPRCTAFFVEDGRAYAAHQQAQARIAELEAALAEAREQNSQLEDVLERHDRPGGDE